MRPFFTFVFVAVTLVVSTTVSAQPVPVDSVKVGMYPRSAFEKKSLAVGTPVWVNIGDDVCAYGQKYPLAVDRCFENEYAKGKIVEVYSRNSKLWYRIEYQFRNYKGGAEAVLDASYLTYNLPTKWAEHSTFFILINW